VATNLRHTIAQSGSATVASGTNYNLTANTPSAEIVIGKNQLVRVAPTFLNVGIFVRFGPAGTNTSSIADVYVPYGVVEVFDMGAVNSSICLMATSTATAQVTIVSRS
jgi:hypothetical protein